MHPYYQCKGAHITIKLFRKQVAVISAELNPPVPCNDYDARVRSFGLVGTWATTQSGFAITGYASGRQLLISKQNGAYQMTELNYPTTRNTNTIA